MSQSPVKNVNRDQACSQPKDGEDSSLKISPMTGMPVAAKKQSDITVKSRIIVFKVPKRKLEEILSVQTPDQPVASVPKDTKETREKDSPKSQSTGVSIDPEPKRQRTNKEPKIPPPKKPRTTKGKSKQQPTQDRPDLLIRQKLSEQCSTRARLMLLMRGQPIQNPASRSLGTEEVSKQRRHTDPRYERYGRNRNKQ